MSSPTLAGRKSASAGPGVEIRRADSADRAVAWEIQSAAFGLSPGAPPSHPGAREEVRVLCLDGRVVSCLTLIHGRLWMRGATLSMAGIRHVTTRAEEQNHGYAGALLRNTLRELRRRRVLSSVLFPFSFRYYRKFGYELGGNSCQVWCRPDSVPRFREASGCRNAGPEDACALTRYYRRRAGDSACSLARDDSRWRRICTDPALTTLLCPAPDGAGEPEAYAVLSEERDPYRGPVVRVLDLAATSPSGWRALLGRLAQVQAESLEWSASAADLAASNLLRSAAPLREGFRPRAIATVRPMFQFRVVDVEGALRARLPVFPRSVGSLAIQVRDELLPENDRPVAVESGPTSCLLRPARPEDPLIDLSIQTFSQLFCGYLSPADAAAQDLLAASSPEAVDIAERLLPPGDPFLSDLDRF